MDRWRNSASCVWERDREGGERSPFLNTVAKNYYFFLDMCIAYVQNQTVGYRIRLLSIAQPYDARWGWLLRYGVDWQIDHRLWWQERKLYVLDKSIQHYYNQIYNNL